MKASVSPCLACLFAFTLLTPAASAATFTVMNTDDSGGGSLREAIIAANANPDPDTIIFDQGLSNKTIRLTTGELIIDSDLTIDGASLPVPITISGENSSRVFLVDSGGHTVTLDSLVISQGLGTNAVTTSPDGGGIRNEGGMLTVSNSTLSGNQGGWGGGILNNGGTLTVSNSTLSGNRAGADGYGGGICTLGGTATVSNSTLSDNRAGDSFGHGGGIYNNGGTLTVSNSTLSGNYAGTDASDDSGGGGGGIYNEFGTLTVANSTLSGNYGGGDGGGIYNEFGTLTVANSTLSGNHAGDGNFSGQDGGGIYNEFGTLTVANSTLSGNHAGDGSIAGGDGGGIFNSGPLTVSNSIIAGNFAGVGGSGNSEGADIDNNGASITPLGPNLIGDNETVESFFPSSSPLVGTKTSPLDPMLGALADNGGPTLTMLPLAGSPAIDAGDFSQRPEDTADLDGDNNTTELLPISTDQRGFTRVSGSALDLGAVEVQQTNNGGATSPPKDTWSVHYQKADADFAYYISIGDTNFAWAFFYFNKALGDFAFHSAYGRHAEATFWFHTWVGAYHYYYFQIIPGAEGAKAAAYQLRFWYAWAYFYYHSKRGEKDLADYWFNYWYSEALAFL